MNTEYKMEPIDSVYRHAQELLNSTMTVAVRAARAINLDWSRSSLITCPFTAGQMDPHARCKGLRCFRWTVELDGRQVTFEGCRKHAARALETHQRAAR